MSVWPANDDDDDDDDDDDVDDDDGVRMMMMMNKSCAACWRVNGCLYGAGLPTNGLSPCLETRPNAPAGPTRRVRDSECQVVKRVKYYRHS